MMLYNRKIFAEAGVTSVPQTYSEYLAAAAKIVHSSGPYGRVDHWMGMSSIQPIWWHRMFDYYCCYVAASGGAGIFDDDHVAFGNQASVKVFAFFRQLYEKKYFPLTGFQGDPFVNSYVATLFVGPWHLTYLEKNKKPDFDYDVAPVPVPDDYNGPSRAFGSMKSICIFKTSKFPAQAWEFAKFLVNRENDFRVLSMTNQIPCRKGLDSDPLYADYLAAHPKLAKFAAQAPNARDFDANPNLKEVLDAIAQEYEACVLNRSKTPQQAIDDAVKQAQVIVQWNK
jgi:multiple sugar transport system substrate-binding protein